MKTTWTLAGVAAFGIFAAGIALPAVLDGNGEERSPSAQPTFTKDVLPILQKSCQGCHRPGTIAPMSLLTYEQVRPWARSIKEKVVTRYMPPWHIDRTVGEYSPDPSLSDAEIAMIAKWVDSGAPRGDPKDAPPPRVFPPANSWIFGEEPDLVVTSSGFNVPAVAADQYPKVDVPTGLNEDRYIKWMQVIPEDPKVLHHVLIYALQGEPATGGVRGDQRRLASGSLLTEYARGNDGDIFTNGTAKLLKAGSRLRFSFHYHPNGEKPVNEHAKIGFRFFPKGYTPKYLISTKGISSPATLAIPPGDPNARSDAYFRLEDPARLVSFQPHMHYRGKRMTLEAIWPDGHTELLTDVAHFVWTWQITYPYKNPPAFPKGTVLHMTAYHDNSPGNKENPDPSAFVGWGDRTVDEMNIGWLDFYYISEHEYAEVQKQKDTRSKTIATAGNPQ
ncbi:MAG TPA: alkyl hydroperoxide reductase [Blastocatellia bacterium]|nr:alkyl hydroperoxide reductase [Blastocatellia bacterium]